MESEEGVNQKHATTFKGRGPDKNVEKNSTFFAAFIFEYNF